VTAAELLSVRERIASINAFAEIIETKHSKAPLKQVCFLTQSYNIAYFQRSLMILMSGSASSIVLNASLLRVAAFTLRSLKHTA
jgi:hypothetical protein